MHLNVSVLKGLCVALPAAAMAASHWFPWRRICRRDLHRLEAYAIGTVAIVGTAAVAISNSDGDRNDHAGLLLLAAGAAGATTLVAYALDEFAKMRGEIAGLKAQRDILGGQ